jgi:glycosyltransferase involved in cell wall biosynthesis
MNTEMEKFDFDAVPLKALDLSAIVPDCRDASIERNFACAGEARALNEIYQDTPDPRVVWQPDVYAEAALLAAQHGVKTVIDVGCGNGEKLIHHFPRDTFKTIGLDFHGSLSLVREAFPERLWIECDLTSQDDLSRAVTGETDDGPVLLILSDVIEHLVDPLPLLAWLRQFLLRDDRNRLVVSTPDRSCQGYADENSMPANGAHLREWTLAELMQFLVSAGFFPVRHGLTRMNQFDPDFSTIFVELSCRKDHYVQFLKRAGLIFHDVFPRHLIVTLEYAGVHNTGGIGTFAAEQRITYGRGATLCLFAGDVSSVDVAPLRNEELVTPGDVLDWSDIESLPVEDRILRAVQQLLFFFPSLETIQYADYQGHGCRIAQAKRAGMLPPTVEVVVHCHGGTHYLENAHESWFGASHLGVAEREKISIEKADWVVFPTAFLRDLYAEIGIEIPPERIVMMRYPYHAPVPRRRPTTKVDTLVFFGKRSTMKGYGLFLRALAREDLEEWKALGVRTITIIGPNVDTSAEHAALLAELKRHYEVEEFTGLNRASAMQAVYERAHRSICVMPYLADNHPLALLDVAFSTALPCMVKAGGVVDLFPTEHRDTLMSLPRENDLRTLLLALVGMAADEREHLRDTFLRAMVEEQKRINERVKNFAPKTPRAKALRSVGRSTIIVPVFNTPIVYVRELAGAINHQTVLPHEVIFVDDASAEGYHSELVDALKDVLLIPYRVIRHPENKGLAAARNTALAAATTDYIINVDSDDVPLNDFVRDIGRALSADDDVVAATPYLEAFDDEDDFNRVRKGRYVYRPLGDGVIASQVDNILGHANSGFKRVPLLQYGGWDESSKSMWEDWALYLKIASSGKKIAVLPKTGCLYRVRASSMLRTYSTWPAMRRLARNMEGLPRFENFRLQSMMRYQHRQGIELDAMRVQLAADQAAISNQQAVISVQQGQLARASVRAVVRLADRISQHPWLFFVLKRSGQLTWKSMRYIAKHKRAVRYDKRGAR